MLLAIQGTVLGWRGSALLSLPIMYPDNSTKIKIAGASTEVSIDEILQSELKKKKRKDSKIFMPPYPTTM